PVLLVPRPAELQGEYAILRRSPPHASIDTLTGTRRRLGPQGEGSQEGADAMPICDGCQQTTTPVIEIDEVTQDWLVHAVLERGLVVPAKLNNALLRPHVALCEQCAMNLNDWIDRFNFIQAHYGRGKDQRREFQHGR